MYRMVYRQEGGLSNLNPHDYMRQEVDKSLAKFKQRSSNVGQQARSRPVPQPGIGQRIKKGISSLIPDTVKNYAAIPINVFNSLGGGNTGYMSPEMTEATRQAALNAIERTGQNTNVAMDSSDYYGTKGFGSGEGELDAGTLGGYPQIFTDTGSGAGSAAVTYGGATVNKNPGTGEISFTPGSGDYDMSDNNPLWLGGVPGYLGLSDKNPMNVPMESFIDPAFTAAKEYGDIEAQAEADRLRQEQTPGVTITDSRHPDYALFNQEQRTSYDEASLRRKGYSEQDINRLHQEGRIDTAINSVDPFVSIADSRHPEYALFNQVAPQESNYSTPQPFDTTSYYNYLKNKTGRTAEENAHYNMLKTPVAMHESGLSSLPISEGSLSRAILNFRDKY